MFKVVLYIGYLINGQDLRTSKLRTNYNVGHDSPQDRVDKEEHGQTGTKTTTNYYSTTTTNICINQAHDIANINVSSR